MTNPFAIRCVICSGEIEMGKVKYVDEDGYPVHEPCYTAQVTKKPQAARLYRRTIPLRGRTCSDAIVSVKS